MNSFSHTIRCPQYFSDSLAKAHIAIVGAGGLGSNIAVMLIRAGIGELSIFDYDQVEIHNLNRQYFSRLHLGIPKVEALKEQLLQINPDATVHIHNLKITSANIKELLNNFEIVVEAVDIAETKALIVETLLLENPHVKIISGSGMAGSGNANSIQTHQRFNRLYICGDLSSEYTEANGIWPTRVMLCAAHQAHKVIEILIES